jgi:hypothetical protein
MSDLIMRSKGLAIFDKLLSLVGSPFELANLYHFGTDLSNGLDGTRPQIFDMLNELWKRDESAIFGKNLTLYHAKFVNANHRTVFKAFGADTKQKQCLCVSSATINIFNGSLASCARVAICNISQIGRLSSTALVNLAHESTVTHV